MKVAALALVCLQLVGCVGDWTAAKSDAGASASEATPDASGADGEALDPSYVDPGLSPDGLDADAPVSGLDAGAEPERDVEAGQTGQAGDPDATSAALDGGDAATAQDAEVRDAAPARAAAIATVDTPCTQSVELACAGHNAAQKLVCLDGKWTFNGSCDGQTRCDTRFGVTQGTCQQVITPCLGKRPGDSLCEALERKACGPDLLDEQPLGCGLHAHCDASNAGCTCDRGFAATAGECQDIVDCSPGACSPGGHCVEGLETFECVCDTGFQPSSDKKTCVNINDCKPGICGTGGTCKDGINGYECSCALGYVLNTTKTACINPNDCPAVDPCAPVGTCLDGLNDFSCQCQPQWGDFGNHVCEYIDPCGCVSGCCGCCG